MTELLGSESESARFAEALAENVVRARKCIRLNSLRDYPLASMQKDDGLVISKAVPWCQRAYWADLSALAPLETHPLVGAGLVYLQEAGATEAVELLEVKPGHRVLDLCAAPGGKATQIGEDLRGQGWLVANEPVRARAERLDLLLSRHGISNVSVFALDPSSLAERFAGFFDRILVDAPCSGESLFAKRTEMRGDVRDAEVSGCARRQFVILSRAAEMLKDGGRLVYSTCTYSFEENEGIVEGFLKEHPEYRLVRQQRRWPHLDGVAGGFAALLEKAVTNEASPSDLTQIFLDPGTGSLRHAGFRWDAKSDDYARFMASPHLGHDEAAALGEVWGEAPPLSPSLRALNLSEARAFLQGQVLPSDGGDKGLCGLSWQGQKLGLAKSVENRLNNLLPKILRGLA